MPVYSGRVVLCVTRDAWQRTQRQIDDSEYKNIAGVHGLSTRLYDTDKDESVYLIGVFDGRDRTLVHELAHTCFEMLTYSGVPISRRNDEAFAYLMDSLYGLVMDAAKRLRKRKR